MGMGITLGSALALAAPYIPRAFTSDPGVLQQMTAIMPVSRGWTHARSVLPWVEGRE